MIWLLLFSAKCLYLQMIPNFTTELEDKVDSYTIYSMARTPDDIIQLQEDINKLVEWANKWQMSFKVDKSFVMHIRQNIMQSNYNMYNQQLPSTDQQRDLGINITKDLKWQKQIEKSYKTAYRELGFVPSNFRYKSKELNLPLYKSLVCLHL